MGLFWSDGKTRLCFSIDGKPEDPELVFVEDERVGVEAVFSALESGGIDSAKVFFERTEDYLKLLVKVERDGVMLPRDFCRLKLSGRSLYISLPISSRDAKSLSSDARFIGLDIGKKRYSKIPLNTPSDIVSLSDVVLLGYRWGVA
jgi:hypothetical protein